MTLLQSDGTVEFVIVAGVLIWRLALARYRTWYASSEREHWRRERESHAAEE